MLYTEKAKIPGYDVGAGFLGILVDFLASSGCLRAWPGPQWAMVGHGGRLVAETDEEATDERPNHLPALGEPPFGITWPRFNLPSSTHLDFDPFHRYSTQV